MDFPKKKFEIGAGGANFLRRRQNFEKIVLKRHFSENVDKKIAFFRRALPPHN